MQVKGALGETLTGLSRFDEAQALLREVWETAKADPATDAAALQGQRRTLQRLIRLYSAWGKPDQASQFQTALEQLPP